MPTETRTTANDQEFEQAANRFRELNEQAIDNARNAGNVYLDLYTRTLHSVADLQEQVAGASQVGPVVELTKAQARFTRDFADASASAARELLK
ncbi:MAG: hypothetical protein M3N16_06770 [Actinomycetota bacterium]|nr:hypothetical protein [Actinomycetota bacterium]